MSIETSQLGPRLAGRIREARAAITGRWLERLAARVSVPPQRIFPTDDLLDHMPLLIEGIAAYIEDTSRTISADSEVVHRARELGALRHSQGFSEYEILKEFEILGGILFSFVKDEVEALGVDVINLAGIDVCRWLFQALALIQQATTARFLELARERTAERESRLRAFNRALTHEMRNRVNATLGAGQMLQSLELSSEERSQLASVVVRNADNMRLVLENLLELTRLAMDARQQRHVPLASAISEVTRQLRDLAADRELELGVVPDIPNVEVNAAAVELCLANLIANGIKYSDRKKSDRWVRVSADLMSDSPEATREVVVAVEDNGIGIPAESVALLFERFYRAGNAVAIEGTGLGLSLVKEAVESVGGRVWAENSQHGTKFCFAMPCRRVVDGVSSPAVLPVPST